MTCRKATLQKSQRLRLHAELRGDCEGVLNRPAQGSQALAPSPPPPSHVPRFVRTARGQQCDPGLCEEGCTPRVPPASGRGSVPAEHAAREPRAGGSLALGGHLPVPRRDTGRARAGAPVCAAQCVTAAEEPRGPAAPRARLLSASTSPGDKCAGPRGPGGVRAETEMFPEQRFMFSLREVGPAVGAPVPGFLRRESRAALGVRSAISGHVRRGAAVTTRSHTCARPCPPASRPRPPPGLGHHHPRGLWDRSRNWGGAGDGASLLTPLAQPSRLGRAAHSWPSGISWYHTPPSPHPQCGRGSVRTATLASLE